jgi:ribose transport system substrate-binding protein
MKDSINHMLRLLACAALGAVLGGCGGKDQEDVDHRPDAAATGVERYLVVFSQCNNAEPYRAAQNKLIQKLAAAYKDIELEIMDAQQDNSRQISQIETAIRKKPSLLIVAPNERGPLTRIMGEAVKAGIPTICLERDIVEPNYTTFIKCDNRAIGRLAGEFILEHLKKKHGEPKGRIVELRGLLGVQAEVERYEGAHEVLDPYPGIEFVQEAVADWLQSKGKDRMTEILRAQPEIDVVYGHNDPMAIGAYLAAKDLDRDAEMIFVGVDGLGGEAGGIKKVMDGVLAATFVYPLCIDRAMEVGMQILRTSDFEPEPEYVMDSLMVTPANAAEVYERVTLP